MDTGADREQSSGWRYRVKEFIKGDWLAITVIVVAVVIFVLAIASGVSWLQREVLHPTTPDDVVGIAGLVVEFCGVAVSSFFIVTIWTVVAGNDQRRKVEERITREEAELRSRSEELRGWLENSMERLERVIEKDEIRIQAFESRLVESEKRLMNLQDADKLKLELRHDFDRRIDLLEKEMRDHVAGMHLSAEQLTNEVGSKIKLALFESIFQSSLHAWGGGLASVASPPSPVQREVPDTGQPSVP